jgi:recombinational DNA repair ATPase RecF
MTSSLRRFKDRLLNAFSARRSRTYLASGHSVRPIACLVKTCKSGPGFRGVDESHHRWHKDQLEAPRPAGVHALQAGQAVAALRWPGGPPNVTVAAERAHETIASRLAGAPRVEGFRGIGELAELRIQPGPGLTLVIGRNGSGKSSFAEALEVLLTGVNPRWAKRSAVWRDGWRNLHHAHAEVEATLAVEAHRGPTFVRRAWRDEDDLDSSTVEVQPYGEPKADLSFLGWSDALSMYRPFLSYSELGTMLDEGPTKLHDAVSSVLGLDELSDAEKALKDVRLERERAVKAVLAERQPIIEALEQVADERAAKAIAALRLETPNADALAELVVEDKAVPGTAELTMLQRVGAYEFVDQAQVEAAVEELEAAETELVKLTGTHADRLLRGADILETALAFRETFAENDCPVCGSENVLTDKWATRAREQANTQRMAANEARRAHKRRQRALESARDLITAVPGAIRDARGLLDVSETIDSWKHLDELRAVEDPRELARELPRRSAAVGEAVAVLVAAARREVERRQDAWRPVALNLARWVEDARVAFARSGRVKELKEAEAWLRSSGEALRNERFAPIADEAMEIWRLLRQQSNVELGRPELAGVGVKRRVALDVTVDGVPAAALGVMSQGELHALALSLFFPRATLDESPFRFVVVDDPVQSMDPAKVDGLAKVLERAAEKRQVVVFTHDDRLFEAIRRLGIAADVIEVSRRENSRVDVRPALTPIDRYVEDARVLCRTTNLPEDVARRVVPGFCRFAVEAACIEAFRRRRIGVGEPHADVEHALSRANKLTTFAALALFDDSDRGGDVLGTINQRFGKQSADAFQAANKGAHEGYGGDLQDLVRDAAILARKLAVLP